MILCNCPNCSAHELVQIYKAELMWQQCLALLWSQRAMALEGKEV